ncbi:methyltransferase [Brevibacterium spongiae]|uniref:Class I SAM-dependent methyltransferase n=1 Tax=Brevibacterium spongiae TaxID=2909672 RepID=A0ABY5SQP3_9MICO|nr:methyltransferase [Brevibacterium spongiae]UVI35029.1 class I SAM-dependent methyltransferase [Brevibacterium spongiae]
MSASLLLPDSAAAHRSRDLLAEFPQLHDVPGLPQARMLVEYIIGRRLRELDVSGRDAAGAFIDAEATADVPHHIIVVDDAKGIQIALLRRLAEVAVYHDRIDESRTAALIADRPESPDRSELFDVHHISELSQLGTEFAGLGWATSAGEGNAETWAVINAPKAANALAESIAALQAHVSTIIVIGRSDAMSRAVNKELSRGFGRVDVSPGVGKHRMIIGSRPLSSPSLPSFPKHGVIAHSGVGDLEVRAHGACFSGVRSDEGSTLLLDALLETLPDAGAKPESVLDLGCGNGWLLTAAMRATGASRGTGVDVSKAAVASARATAEANGVDVDVDVDIVLGDAANPEDPAVAGLGTFDLVVLNPPFHQGTTIETETAEALMATAAAHLSPGGQVVTVFNTHLRYRDRLETLIGPSEQLARNTKFTVISSRAG